MFSIRSHVCGRRYFNVSSGLPLRIARTRPVTSLPTFGVKNEPARKFVIFSRTV
jgi:hypothetical protein